MTTIKLALITFLLAIFSACQEDLINESESDQIFKNTPLIKNSLKICCGFRDPNYGICNINGCVEYTLEIIRETMYPRAVSIISVKLCMNSILSNYLGIVHREWRAEGRSEDIVYVSEEGIAFLEKCYRITNRNDVDLLVRYMVNINGIGISEVILAPVGKKIQNINYKKY